MKIHSKIKFFFTFLASLISFALFSQPNTWVSVYGGNKYDRGTGITQTPDKGYVVCGNTSSYGSGNTDIYLLKIDSVGKYQWQHTLGDYNIDQAYSVQLTQDSGFIICGYTNSFGAGGYDAYIVKTDPNGIFEWQKTFGENDWDFAYWAEQTDDGGYIVCGESYRDGKNSDGYAVKTNSSGDTLWTRTFGTTGEDAFKEVHQTSDGGFVFGGYTTSSTGDKDFFLLKTDPSGGLEWEKTFGTTANDSCSSIDICTDGGFLMGGCRDTLGELKTYLLKTDPNGIEQLFNTEMKATGNLSISRIRETVEGHFTYLAITDVGGNGGQEIFLIKYDPTGDWHPFVKTFGGNKNEDGYDFVQNSDSGYTLVGYTGTFGPGPDNIFIARTDKSGEYNQTINSFVSVNEIPEEKSDLFVYPNPTSGKISVHSQKLKISSIKICTIMGEVIISIENPSFKEIDLSAYTNGIYLLEIITSEGNERKKIIVSK